MSVSRPIEQARSISVTSALPTNDAGNATLFLDGATGALFECTAVSGLTGTIEVKTTEGGTWRQWRCVQVTSGTGTDRAAGATITLTAADLIFVPTAGFYAVRFKRASGTSATFAVRTFENAADMSALLTSVTLGQATMANSFPVVLASDQTYNNKVTVLGGWAVGTTYTRDDNTTQYAAGDAVADSDSAPTVLTFLNCAAANGLGGTIVKATLGIGSNQATAADLELWIFDTTFTPDNDNAVFTPTDAELATCVGVIEFPSSGYSAIGDATSGANGNRFYWGKSTNFPIDFVCGASSRNLFGALVVRNDYTPLASTEIYIRLHIEQR